MLIHITGHVSGRKLSATEVDALRNLGIAYREGKHILLIQSNAHASVKADQIGRSAKAALDKATNDWAKNAPIAKALKRIVCVSLSGEVVEPYIETRGGQVIHNMPLSVFSDTATVQETALIGEDDSDSQNYIALSKMVINGGGLEGCRGLNLRFYADSGGGSSIGKCVSNYARSSRRFFFAIGETDKKHPNDSIVGKTAHVLKDAVTGELVWGGYHIIEAHEIENLAPWAVVEDAIQRGGVREPHRSAYQKIFHATDERLWLYVDLKDGLSVTRFRSLPGDTRQKYEKFLRECRIDPDTCTCPVLLGLGDTNIRNAFARFVSQSQQTVLSLDAFRQDQVEELKAVALEVVAWCCAKASFRI